MTIHEAAKKTGLTKKAIRYYEDKKLISPETNRKSGYKNYSHDDISQLDQIAFLRNLDMPVSSILLYLKADAKAQKGLLRSHLEQVKKDIAKLKNISAILEKELGGKLDRGASDKDFSKFPESTKAFALDRISKLFPTPLGKYIRIHFGPYLDEPADTREKRMRLII